MKTLPELTGNTRVYLDDDTPTNSIAGILYPNPAGTKFCATNEAYTDRGANRALGNIAANCDELFVNQFLEVAYPVRISLTPAATEVTLSGRFLVQDIDLEQLTKIIHSATGEEYFISAGNKLVVDKIEYDDAGSGLIRVDNLPAATEVLIVNSSSLITAMLRYGLQTTADISAAAPGDHCVLTGGNNAGTYLIVAINGDTLTLANLDGTPVQLGPAAMSNKLTGFDVDDPPTSFRVIGNGRILSDPVVTFNYAVPAAAFDLVIGQAYRRPYDHAQPAFSVQTTETIPEKVMEVIMDMKGLTGSSPNWITPVSVNLDELASLSLDTAYDTPTTLDPPGSGRVINVDAGAVELRYNNERSWGDTRDAALAIDGAGALVAAESLSFIDLASWTRWSNYLLARRTVVEIDGDEEGAATLSTGSNTLTITGTVDLSPLDVGDDYQLQLLVWVKDSNVSSDDGLYVVTALDAGTQELEVSDFTTGIVNFAGTAATVSLFYPQAVVGPSSTSGYATLLLTDAENIDRYGSYDQWNADSLLNLTTLRERKGLRIGSNDEQSADFLTTYGRETSTLYSFAVINSRSDELNPATSTNHWVGALENRTPIENGVELRHWEPATGNNDDTFTLVRAGAGNVDDPAIITLLDGREWTDLFVHIEGMGSNAPHYDDNDGVYMVAEVYPGTKTFRLLDPGKGVAPSPALNNIQGRVSFFSRDVVIKDKTASHTTPSAIESAFLRIRTKRDESAMRGIDILAPGCQNQGTALNIEGIGTAAADSALVRISDATAEPSDALGSTILGWQEAGTTHAFLEVFNETDVSGAHVFAAHLRGANPPGSEDTAILFGELESGADVFGGTHLIARAGSSFKSMHRVEILSGSFGAEAGIYVENETATPSISASQNPSTAGVLLKLSSDIHNVFNIRTDIGQRRVLYGTSDEWEDTRIMPLSETTISGRGRDTAGFSFNTGESLLKCRCFPFASGIRSFVPRARALRIDNFQQISGSEHLCYRQQAEGGTVDYIELSTLESSDDDVYVGWILQRIDFGPPVYDKNQVILDYNGSTRLAFPANPFDPPPHLGDEYQITSPTEHTWQTYPGRLVGRGDCKGAVLLDVDAQPGTLFAGVHASVAGDYGTSNTWGLSFLREVPSIPLSVAQGGTGEVDATIGELRSAATAPVPREEGPNESTLNDDRVSIPCSLPTVSESGLLVPCWVADLGTATFSVSGTNSYLVTFSGKSGELGKIIAHWSSAFDTPSKMGNLKIPFLGDYLWLRNGSNAGFYPIIDVAVSGSDLTVRIMTDAALDTSPTTPSSQCHIPALVNPGGKVSLRVETPDYPGGGGPSSRTVDIYPGVSHVLVPSDTAAAGVPHSTTPF